jgi:site-specific DNA recombinase
MARQKKRRVSKNSKVNYEYIQAHNNQDRKNKRAVGYCRVSTRDQVEKVSLEYQENEINKWCVYKDFDLMDMYIEKGESGRKKDRTEMSRLLEDAKEGKFDIVICYATDRFGRSFRSLMQHVFELEDFGIPVRFLNPDFQTDDPIGRTLLAIYASFAEEEVERISQRLIMGKKDKVKQGHYISKKPFGYDVEDGQLSINKKEAEVVKEIYRLKAYERLSYRKIEAVLNKKGIPSPNNGKWSYATINKILKNRLYIGELNHKVGDENIVIPDNHEAIISKQVFTRANNKGVKDND